MLVLLVLAQAILECAAYIPAQGCTALAVGRKATKDGSTMVTHGNDCPSCDFRLAYVPARTYPAGSMMPVYMAKNDYPRYVGNRSATYSAEKLEKRFPFSWPETKPMGEIPQVESTYAYYDGAYGIMNEHQLGIGESTCDARLGLKGIPIQNGGKALFDISALSRVALERCQTARCAVQLMGNLACTYGFYGGQLPDWTGHNMTDAGEGGEALVISDPKEVWVFLISPDDTGESAVWVAQKVPDSHVSVVTNVFTIGEIDLGDSDNYLASPNIHDVAVRNHFWDPSSEPFNFASAYRIPSKSGFVDRRRWEVFKRLAPSHKYNPYARPAWDGSTTYLPWSVVPEYPVTVEDIMAIHADNFEQTPFDLETDVIAGPWGDPYRASLPRGAPFNTSTYHGNFERAVAQTWTSYTVITQSRSDFPDEIGGRFWYGPHDATTTMWVPIYPGSHKDAPDPVAVGSLLRVDAGSVWWSVCLTANYMARFFSILLPNVTHARHALVTDVLDRLDNLESHALKEHRNNNIARAHHILNRVNNEISEYILKEWWAFFFDLVAYFHDGTKFIPGQTIRFGGTPYPAWWIKFIGQAGVHTAKYANEHPDLAYLNSTHHEARQPNLDEHRPPNHQPDDPANNRNPAPHPSPMPISVSAPTPLEAVSTAEICLQPILQSGFAVALLLFVFAAGLLTRPIFDSWLRRSQYQSVDDF
jgi:dipeptidase